MHGMNRYAFNGLLLTGIGTLMFIVFFIGCTPAAKMEKPVGESAKKERARKLRQLGYKLAREYRNKFKGQKLDMVIENIKEGKCAGKTEYYFDVSFKTRPKKGVKGIVSIKI